MLIRLSLLQVRCRTSLLSTQSVSPVQFSCPCCMVYTHNVRSSSFNCMVTWDVHIPQYMQSSSSPCYNYQNPHHPFLTFTLFTLATRSSIFLIATYSGLFNSYRGQTVFTKILLSVVHHASVIVLASKRVNIKTSAVFSKIDLCT